MTNPQTTKDPIDGYIKNMNEQMKEKIERSITTCAYPVIEGLGQCCGDSPCSVQWRRPCDETGGCIDRSTCGGCEEPAFKGDKNYVEG